MFVKLIFHFILSYIWLDFVPTNRSYTRNIYEPGQTCCELYKLHYVSVHYNLQIII